MPSYESRFLEVLDRLYQGVLDESEWQVALTAMTDLVTASGVVLFSLNPATREVYRTDRVRFDAADWKAYSDYWFSQDIRYPTAMSWVVGRPMTEAMLLSRHELIHSAIYNDYLEPIDDPHFMPTWVERTATRGVIVSFQGTRRRGPFGADEQRHAAQLVPHLRRIVEMKDRLQGARVAAAGLMESMDRLPFGFLLLAADLEILEASAPAAALLTQRDGLLADRGRLGFARAVDRAAFARRLREDPAQASLNDSVLVRRKAREPLSLIVLPLPASQESWLRAKARWMVMIFDPARGSEVPEQSLRARFGLTPAEALLARELTNGQTLAGAAERLGISVHTARTQLKGVFGKTGVRKQSQLVQRILTSEAIIRRV